MRNQTPRARAESKVRRMVRQLLRVGWTTWKLGASLLALAVSAKGRAQRSSRQRTVERPQARPHPRPRRARQRTQINQSRLSHTTFVYQYQYHPNLIKKRPNTGTIPVNIPHCLLGLGLLVDSCGTRLAPSAQPVTAAPGLHSTHETLAPA